MENANKYQDFFAQANHRYIEYYFSFSKSYSTQFPYLLSEHNNILSALKETHTQLNLQESYFNTVIYLHEYMLQQGHWQFWLDTLEKIVWNDKVPIDLIKKIDLSLKFVELLINLADYKSAQSQLELIDSLLFQIHNLETRYLGMSKYFKSLIAIRVGKYQQALELIYEGYNVLTNEDIILKGVFLSHLGNIYRFLGDIPFAFNALKKAQIIFQQGDEKRHLGGVLNTYGLVYQSIDKYDKAITCFIKAIDLFQKSGDKISFAITHQNLGVVYWSASKFDKALTYLTKATQLAKDTGNQRLLTNTYGDLALVYMDLGHITQSLNCLMYQILVSAQNKDDINYGRGIGNLGIASYYLNRFQKALLYFAIDRKILLSKYDKDASHALSFAYILVYEGLTHYELGNKVKSVTLIEQALMISKSKGYHSVEIIALRGMAKLYPAQAEAFLQEGLLLAEKLGKRLEQGICKFELGIIAKTSNKQTLLLKEAYTLFQKLNSKIWLQKAQQALNQMEVEQTTL